MNWTNPRPVASRNWRRFDHIDVGEAARRLAGIVRRTPLAPLPCDDPRLELRGKILEIAAGLDRIERSGGGEAVGDDTRLQQIDRALEALRQSGGDRAESIQMIFSLPYDPKWRATFAL